MEKFKPIPGWEDYYEASEEGNIRRIGKDRIMVGKVANNGYQQITFCRDGIGRSVLAHRQIAKTYIPNPENKRQINHKNGNKEDNRVVNLEWATMSDNIRHSYKVLGRKPSITMKGRFGKLNAASKPLYQYDMNGNLIKEWESMSLAINAGFTRKCLQYVVRGIHTHHKGFKWSR